MSPETRELFTKLETFSFDGPDPVALSFAARLARENGWSRSYAERVIVEYRRFLFLTATGTEPVCPSEDVDAAWHLHLTYTRNYWKALCGEVLGFPLHHDPTRGGAAEADKHFAMYAKTLDRYRTVFGHAPPTDIWPGPAERFRPSSRPHQDDLDRNWVVPKRAVQRGAAVVAGLGMCAFAVGCAGGDFNPFDLEGADFLYFLIPLLIGAVAVARMIRSHLRGPDPQPGDDQTALTWDQVAYLAGGNPRLAAATVARLVGSGAAVVQSGEKNLIPGPLPTDRPITAVERALHNALPAPKSPEGFKRLVSTAEAAFLPERFRLEEEGLLLSSARQRYIWRGSVVPVLLVLLVVATPRLIMGVANDKPVSFLIATMIIGGLIGLVISLMGNVHLTKRGEGLLVFLRSGHAALKTGGTLGTPDSIGLSVALFGTAVLTTIGLSSLSRWFPPAPAYTGSGGSGCSTSTTGCGTSGGDGGGGCGSGCGGCGGGGGD